MYLEFLTLEGITGEVHLNPYSYKYEGDNGELERWLESEPIYYSEVVADSSEMGSDPVMSEITDERQILIRIGNRLKSGYDVFQYEIVND